MCVPSVASWKGIPRTSTGSKRLERKSINALFNLAAMVCTICDFPTPGGPQMNVDIPARTLSISSGIRSLGLIGGMFISLAIIYSYVGLLKNYTKNFIVG